MPRTKKDVVTEFRTEAILQAANRVFAERGFDQATIAEIAQEAGVAKGTIYLYYPSKQHIYAAAVRRSASELASRTRAAMDQATGASGKVRAFIDATLRYFEQHRDFFCIYCSEAGRTPGRHATHARAADDLCLEHVKGLEQVIQHAVRSGAIRPIRVDAAASAILDITRGVVSQRLRGAGRTRLDEDVACAFDLTWKGIGRR